MKNHRNNVLNLEAEKSKPEKKKKKNSGLNGIRNHGRFPFAKKSRKFWLGCKWNTTFWFVPLEFFRNKRNIWKGSLFSKWKFVFHLQISRLPHKSQAFRDILFPLLQPRWRFSLLHTKFAMNYTNAKTFFSGELLASQTTIVVGLLPWFELVYIKLLWCLLPFWRGF